MNTNFSTAEVSNLSQYLKVFERIIGRTDVLARQLPDRKYRPESQPSENDLKEALKRSIMFDNCTYGAYTISKDNTVVNPQIDIDNHDGKTDVSTIVRKIYEKLISSGVYPYIEGSSGRIEGGAHIGLICKPTPASDAKEFLESVLKELALTGHEVNPKQIEIDKDGFGNLVKLPFQFNNRTNTRSEIINPETMQPFFRKDALEFMLNLKNSKIPKSEKKETKKEQEKPKTTNPTSENLSEILTKVRPCITKAFAEKWDLHGQGKEGHDFRFIVACELIASNANDAVIHEYLKIQSDYDSKETQKQLDQIRKKGYKPKKCVNILSTCPVMMGYVCDTCTLHKKKDEKETEYKPRYVEHNGMIGIWKLEGKEDDKTDVFKPITNFTFEYLKEIRSENGIEYETNIVIGEKKFKFNVDAETTTDNRKFELALKNVCREASFETINTIHVRGAFNANMSFAKMEKIKKVELGWHGEEYVMPSIIITKDGIRKNDKYLIDVPIKSKARFNDMIEISETEFIEVGKHIKEVFMKVHDRFFVNMVMADGFGAPFQRLISEKYGDEIKFAGVDLGEGDVGKSFVNRRMMHFFGDYPELGGIPTWGSTIYSVEHEGSHFRDCLFYVDDITPTTLQREGEQAKFNNLLHNYSSGAGRDRQKGDPTPPIKGSLHLSAEISVVSGSANKGRICDTNVPRLNLSKEQEEKRIEMGDEMLRMQHLYPGFMSRYILFVIHGNNWLDDYFNVFDECNKEFQKLGTTSSIKRASKMHAIRYAHFYHFSKFMNESGFMNNDEMNNELKFMKDRMKQRVLETTDEIKDERHSYMMVNTLKELCASGIIPSSQRHDTIDEAHSRNPVGVVLDDEKNPNVAYLIPAQIIQYLREHMRKINKNFNINQKDIGRELKENKLLVETDDSRNTKQIRFNGARVDTWCVSRESIGIVNADTGVGIRPAIRDAAKMLPTLLKANNITKQPTFNQFYHMLGTWVDTEFHANGIEKNRIMEEIKKEWEMMFVMLGWHIPEKDEVIVEQKQLQQIQFPVNINVNAVYI